MNIPQAMLLEWAARLRNSGLTPNPQTVKTVAREMAQYATSNADEQATLQRFFYNRPEA